MSKMRKRGNETSNGSSTRPDETRRPETTNNGGMQRVWIPRPTSHQEKAVILKLTHYRPVSIRATPGFDDPAAQHPVSLVKDRRLPRAEGPLGRVKLDAQTPVRQRPDRGRSRRARVADLDLGTNRFGQPIQAGRRAD